MSHRLAALTVVLVLLVILLESLSAPYRLVEGLCALGAIMLVLQIPDTIETVQALRRRNARPGSSDEP
jgi:hypothetical protein